MPKRKKRSKKKANARRAPKRLLVTAMARATSKKFVAPKRVSNVPHVLILIAVVLLVINGVVSVLMSNWVLSMAGILPGITKRMLISFGAVWLVIAGLLYYADSRIRTTGEKSSKWLLLILSVIAIISGRAIAGVLSLIASILYLRR